MNILLGDFNAKLGRENIFKLTTENESLHEINNDNGVRVVNFAKTKILIVKRTMFQYRNIDEYACTSIKGKSHNQSDHILIDERRHSSIIDVRSFMAADCDTNHYLVVASAISGIGRGNTSKTNLMSLQQTVRTRKSQPCIREKINLSGATNVEENCKI
jgi:hypothetical protein